MSNAIQSNKIMTFFAIFAICFICFALRRPDIIQNPQFWAEDGVIWYQQAYNIGPLKSLILPQNGYYQTISKAVASLSLFFPVYAAPLFFNVIAISIRCFVVMYLLSSRMGSYPIIGRVVLALFIVLMPNIEEVHANITNTHWYLSMWLFMVIVSEPAGGKIWRIHDYLVLIVSGLSGPFIVFLAPVMFLKLTNGLSYHPVKELIKSTIKRFDLFTSIFIAICVIQVSSILLSTSDTRSHAPLGFSLSVLSSILSSKIFAGFLISKEASRILWDQQLANAIINVIGMCIIAIVFYRGNWKDKSLIIFPALMIGFALAKPMIHMTLPQLPRIQFGPGQRYFVITSVFWLAVLMIFMSKFKLTNSKPAFILLIILLSIGCFKGFNLQKLPSQNWIGEINKFNNANEGESVVMKINPEKWTMRLIKK